MKIVPTDGQRKMMAWLMAGGLSLASAVSSVFLIAPSEGVKNTGYSDPVGIATACYGHTGPDVKVGQWYSSSQCMEWLLKDSGRSEKDVDSVITVPLNVYQKAALISFDYNMGIGRLRSSTMAKLFNQKDYNGGCQQLIKWVYAGKEKLPGLEKRRDTEMQMCLGDLEVQDVQS